MLEGKLNGQPCSVIIVSTIPQVNWDGNGKPVNSYKRCPVVAAVCRVGNAEHPIAVAWADFKQVTIVWPPSDPPVWGVDPVIHLPAEAVGHLHHICQHIIRNGQGPVVFRRNGPIQGVRRQGRYRVSRFNTVHIGFAAQSLGDAGLDTAAHDCDLRGQPLGIRGTAGETSVLSLTVVPQFAAAVVGGIFVAVRHHSPTVGINLYAAAIIVVVGHGDGVQSLNIRVRRLIGLADIGKLDGLPRSQVAHFPVLVISAVVSAKMEGDILGALYHAGGRADGCSLITCLCCSIRPVYRRRDALCTTATPPEGKAPGQPVLHIRQVEIRLSAVIQGHIVFHEARLRIVVIIVLTAAGSPTLRVMGFCVTKIIITPISGTIDTFLYPHPGGNGQFMGHGGLHIECVEGVDQGRGAVPGSVILPGKFLREVQGYIDIRFAPEGDGEIFPPLQKLLVGPLRRVNIPAVLIDHFVVF